MSEIEEWREMPSLPEYEASSLGRIRRVPHTAPMPRGGERTYGGKPWGGVWSEDRFIFSFRGKTYRVARMVCEAFHGTAPSPDHVAMHLDEDASNNRPVNLAWGTQRENLNAPGFLNYCRGRIGFLSPGWIHTLRKEGHPV